MAAPLICVIEDEQVIAGAVAARLRAEGFAVEVAHDGPSGVALCDRVRPDLVVLDVMLPRASGFEVCREIRKSGSEVPILMLTARGQESDKVQGLKLGADDYVTKPFSVAQLVLRVQAVLRRARIVDDGASIRLDGIEVDPRNLAACVDGHDVRFTRREMEVLQYLAGHGERAVPREELLAKVWGYARHLEIETRTVDIHVAKLRRKLERDPKQPRHLVTVRGGGYRLVTVPR